MIYKNVNRFTLDKSNQKLFYNFQIHVFILYSMLFNSPQDVYVCHLALILWTILFQLFLLNFIFWI